MGLQGLMPPPADAIDEAMIANAAERERVAAERRRQDESVLAQQPRGRVSGWRLLDRVLGGQTVTEGLDAERECLSAEANRGGSMERQRQVLASIQDPYERAIFLADPEKWSENAGYRLRPVTTAAGSRTTYGMGPNAFSVEQATFDESGDQTLQRDSRGVRPVYTRETPSIAETIDATVARTGQQNADTSRFNAENPVLAAGATWVGSDNQPRAQGYIAPDIQNVAPGAEALVFNQGQLQGRVGSNSVRPMSDADQAAVARADGQITSLDTSLNRAAAIEAQIARGELNLGLVENVGAGILNAAGASNQNSLNYDALMAWAKEARNAILQANTGVQTDQDAIRELDTILSSSRDERLVTAALRRFREARAATRNALQRDIDRRSGGSAPASSGSSGSVAYDASGRRYVVRNGQWVAE